MRTKLLLFYILVFIAMAVLAAMMGLNNQASAEMAHYQKAEFTCAAVNCNILNMRLGPGLDYPIVSRLYHGEVLRVYAKINSWYLVQNEKNYVGMVKGDYIKSCDQTSSSGQSTSNQTQKSTPTGIKPEEQELLSLINKARKEAGIKALTTDQLLMRTTKAKAEDMVNKNYFSHTSPTYGSPFDMMKNFGVKYRLAGENIAGNPTVRGAFDALMKSESHRKNILNKNFNYIGISVIESKTYGKVMVQQFVGR